MTDGNEKLLLAAISFLLGTTSNIVVDLVREHRRKRAIVDLMATELRAFIAACESAARHHIADATDVRNIAQLLQDRYSKETERWVASRESRLRQAASDFYLECAGYLSLCEIYQLQIRTQGPQTAKAIDADTYSIMSDRAGRFLALLQGGDAGPTAR